MHIADIKVPRSFVKLEDLLSSGRIRYEIVSGKTYYIHNNSTHVLYLKQGEDGEATRVYAGKSAGYVKSGDLDLYVSSELHEVYPSPEYISITFCDDVKADGAVSVGEYLPEKDVKGAYVYKGSFKTVAQLPAEAEIGDVYNIDEDGKNYAWTGEFWDDLGGVFSVDLTPYAKKADMDVKLSGITDELEIKADSADVEAALAEVNFAIETKADKVELDPFATKEYVESRLDEVKDSLSVTATKAELATKADKANNVAYKDFTYEGVARKTIQLDNYDSISGVGTDGAGYHLAMVSNYNVADFGDKDLHCNLNTSQIVTVNDTQAVVTDALMERIVFAGANAKVSKKEMTDEATGFKFNGYEVSADLSKVDGKASLADLDGILFRLGTIEDKVSALEKTNVEAVVSEDGSTLTLVNTEVDYVIAGTVGADSTVAGKSVTLKETAIANNASLKVEASDEIALKAVNLQGEYPTGSGKIILIDESDYVTIKDSTFNATAAYNIIEIGLTSSNMPKGVLIENCRFTGEYKNNAIGIFGTKDNAVININNCYFESVSNVLRLSNQTNAKNVTINITNCTVDKWDVNPKWAGLVICQDYTSGTVAKEEANNLFAPDKLTINISNLTKPDGTKLVAPNNIADICGTLNADTQIVYVWNSKGDSIPYSAERYPAVNIL